MNVLGCTTIQFWKEVLLATAIIYIIKYYFDRWKTFTLGNKIPGPKCWPIIGNTFEFLEHDLGQYNIINNFQFFYALK